MAQLPPLSIPPPSARRAAERHTITRPAPDLHDGEPYFVIRAQDILAPQAVMHYAALARKLGLDHFAQEVEARAVELMHWQTEHAGLVKVPD